MIPMSWADAVAADEATPAGQAEKLEREYQQGLKAEKDGALEEHSRQQLEAQNPAKYAFERLERENQELRERLEALERKLAE